MTDLIGATLDSRYVCQSGADFNIIKLGRHKTEKTESRASEKRVWIIKTDCDCLKKQKNCS